MKYSIRKFLLMNLLLAIAITTSMNAIGNYYLDQKDIQTHLDTLMAISALSYQALLGDDLKKRAVDRIQHDINTIPQQIPSVENTDRNHRFEQLTFQVWSDDGVLLLQSNRAPQPPLNVRIDGFSDMVLNQERWRVFTTHHPTAGIRVVVADRMSARNQLSLRIAQDDLYILLLTFPLSGLLIWFIIGRGLKSLNTIAKEVANRAPSHLEQVNLTEIPDEVRPLIDELNKLFFRLKEGFERETRFAADAAHELRTPLAALKTQAQVALHSDNIDDKNIALQKLIASVNRSTHIVQQLLILSKLVPESASTHNLDAVNLIKITRDILALLAPTAIEKHIDLEFESIEPIPSFPGNATAIGILVRNLVDNAIRYSEKHARVVVRVELKADALMLSVEDNGPGIPITLQPRVFERFFRALGNKSPGSGLGLAIVQQICALHNAKVTLESPEVGTGLIVRVLFPITH